MLILKIQTKQSTWKRAYETSMRA